MSDNAQEGEARGHWIRCWFKGGKVWAECEEDGRLIEREGLVRIAYKKGDKRSYSTHAGRLNPVEGVSVEEGPAAVEPTGGARTGGKKAEAPGSTRRSTAPGSEGGKANSSVFGGSWDEVEDEGAIHLWSDGACSGNPGPAGAGTVLLYAEHQKEIATYLGENTNNGAELTAVLQGLEALHEPVVKTLVIHTDSQYVIGVLARGWKAKANSELVMQLRALLQPLPRVVWHWVRGHEGVALNERCDFLATEAVRTRSSWTS